VGGGAGGCAGCAPGDNGEEVDGGG
jgi:hypothetical protein